MSILDEIFDNKRAEVADQQRAVPLAQVLAAAEQAAPAQDFAGALRAARRKPALIAEVKRASPSRGVLAHDFDPLRLARAYQQNGAAAVSVLTEQRYFQGSLEYLRAIAALNPRLPILCKDFLFDLYQIYEARAAGADAVLLIAAYLKPGQIAELQAAARSLGMAALVEAHDQKELETALSCGASLVGINNRDLRDFSVHLETTLYLRKMIPEDVCVVAESGIHTAADMARLAAAEVDAVLIGEALVTAADAGAKIDSLYEERIAAE